ncbi:MAG: hypothetical protein JSV86_06035 [Gemmatimonadota bacterium]|nr:MAG: hypothetical protein JSV86_06035 [Gemmatimonadota bacterium]
MPLPPDNPPWMTLRSADEQTTVYIRQTSFWALIDKMMVTPAPVIAKENAIRAQLRTDEGDTPADLPREVLRNALSEYYVLMTDEQVAVAETLFL